MASHLPSPCRIVLAGLACLASLAGPRGAGGQTPPAPVAPPAAIVLDDLPVPGLAIRRGRAELVVRAPLEVAARLATDYRRWPAFLAYVRQSRVVHRRPDGADVYVEVPLIEPVLVFWSLVRTTVRRAADRVEIEAHGVEGNIDRFETTAVLERVPGQAATRCTFTLLAVPSLLPAAVVTDELRASARLTAERFRRLAEQDAARGPGPAVP